MNSEAKEVTVILKDSERSYRQKFLCYEDVVLSEDDPIIKEFIEEAMKSAKFTPEDVKVRVLLQV